MAAGRVDPDEGNAVVREAIGRLRSAHDAEEPGSPDLAAALADEAARASEGAASRARQRRTSQPLLPKWRRRAVISAFLSTLLGKLTVTGAAVALATSGLAATGNLPDPAQAAIAKAMSKVGIEIPAPAADLVPDDVTEGRTHRTSDVREESIDATKPVLPEEASDTAKAVTDTVFEGDPADGCEFGADVADTASKGASGAAGGGLPEVPTAPDVVDDPPLPTLPDQTVEPQAPVLPDEALDPQVPELPDQPTELTPGATDRP